MQAFTPDQVERIWLGLLATVVLLAGLFLAIGGVRLTMLGGSPYFVLALVDKA